MNIFKFFKSLITPDLEPSCDGMYHFTSIDSEDDIKILISQIELLPNQPGIDKDWIIRSLGSMLSTPEALEKFIDTYQKIEVGKDMNYKGKPAEFVEQLKIMYPNVKWDGQRAMDIFA